MSFFENGFYYTILSQEKKEAIKALLDENMTYEEAVEFIEYNTLRSIPYCSNAPIVVHMIEDYFVNRQ